MFLYRTKCNKTEFTLTFVDLFKVSTATELQFTNVHYIYIYIYCIYFLHMLTTIAGQAWGPMGQ